VSNITNSAAYIYSGTLDTVTPPNLQEGLKLVYEELGMDADKLILESVATGHGMKETDPSPGAIIEWLFQKLGTNFASSLPFNEQVANPDDYGTTHEIRAERLLNRIGFTAAEKEESIMTGGKIYVPHSCSRRQDRQQCHVHFALHGNPGGDISNGRHLISHFAAQNNIIVVYPRFERGYGNVHGSDPKNNSKDGIFPRIIAGIVDILINGSCPQ